MTKDERTYIKECDCPEIQNGWEPKVWDKVEVRLKGHKWIASVSVAVGDGVVIVIDDDGGRKVCMRKNLTFLPSLDQLIDMMGDRFKDLYRSLDTLWLCSIHSLGSLEDEKVIDGSTRKIACLRAVKEIRKEG